MRVETHIPNLKGCLCNRIFEWLSEQKLSDYFSCSPKIHVSHHLTLFWKLKQYTYLWVHLAGAPASQSQGIWVLSGESSLSEEKIYITISVSKDFINRKVHIHRHWRKLPQSVSKAHFVPWALKLIYLRDIKTGSS